MDDRVQRCLFDQPGGYASYRAAIGKISDDDSGTLVGERAKMHCPVSVSGVHDDVMPLRVQGFCGEAAESVSGPGDEDATHDYSPSRAVRMSVPTGTARLIAMLKSDEPNEAGELKQKVGVHLGSREVRTSPMS